MLERVRERPKEIVRGRAHTRETEREQFMEEGAHKRQKEREREGVRKRG